MWKFIFMVAILVFMAFCSGCATLVSDDKTFTQIDTVPTGAECAVEGENYKQIINTPANLMLPASAAPLIITCNMDGYHIMAEYVDTEIDGWIIGNILFGGVIGAVVDAANDKGEKYPEQVTLVLYRKDFASQDELNAWYELKEKEINEKINVQVAEAKGSKSKIEKLEKLRTEHLAQMRKFRSESRVIPTVLPKDTEQ